MTVVEVAKILEIHPQFLREKIKQGVFPFAVAHKYKRWTYHIFEDRFWLWKEGKL